MTGQIKVEGLYIDVDTLRKILDVAGSLDVGVTFERCHFDETAVAFLNAFILEKRHHFAAWEAEMEDK